MELTLLRMYRATGAHSAASEQYAHYAAYLRDELGVEPPALSTL
jgi:DNA-binding SARP family transcriptional activator